MAKDKVKKDSKKNLFDKIWEWAKGDLRYPNMMERVAIVYKAKELMQLVKDQQDYQAKYKKEVKSREADFFVIYNYPETSEKFKRSFDNLQRSFK